MLERIKQELVDIDRDIALLEENKSTLEIESQNQRAQLIAINDQIAEIQSKLIQRNRIKTELEIVEKWLSEKETSGGVI